MCISAINTMDLMWTDGVTMVLNSTLGADDDRCAASLCVPELLTPVNAALVQLYAVCIIP
jgi:hypothetical protein